MLLKRERFAGAWPEDSINRRVELVQDEKQRRHPAWDKPPLPEKAYRRLNENRIKQARERIKR